VKQGMHLILKTCMYHFQSHPESDSQQIFVNYGLLLIHINVTVKAEEKPGKARISMKVFLSV
jgi:hypothetical protein